MSAQNKELVHTTFQEIWNGRNLDIIKERLSRDYVGHSVREIQGPQGAKGFAAAILDAFPDYRYTVEDEICEGDKVVHRWIAKGTHEGEFQGLPPSGKQVTISGISVYRVANGKLVEGWTTADMLGLLQQIGAVPSSG